MRWRSWRAIRRMTTGPGEGDTFGADPFGTVSVPMPELRLSGADGDRP